jgi:HSP20 family molecular chaperone IbpA
MTPKAQPSMEQPVAVVEADIFDRMNETRSLIAQRAYEIYESRGGSHGSDQDDWLRAEEELLPKLPTEYDVTDDAVRLTAKVPCFDAKELEVEVGHRLAVVCGVHYDSNKLPANHRKSERVMGIIELPFDVDPLLARATLRSGTLQIVLPRLP